MQPDMLRAAARWHAHFCSGEADEADRRAWGQWLEADPAHRRAWQRLEALQQQLQRLPGEVSAGALRSAAARKTVDRTRRGVLKGVAFTAVGGSALWLSHRQTPWPQRLAEYRTQVGERREWQLADGSRLLLNTNSAVDVDFDARQRLVRLHAGEVMVQTAKDPQDVARPFLVRTGQGAIRALGTRFLVRQQPDDTLVTVLQDRVEIRPERLAESRQLAAGGQLRFTAGHFGPEARVVADADADWTRGMLVVADWPLERFVVELARYRPGRLSCDPAVAGLRISGAFPVNDTDHALKALAKALPVRLVARQGGLWGRTPELRIEPL